MDWKQYICRCVDYLCKEHHKQPDKWVSKRILTGNLKSEFIEYFEVRIFSVFILFFYSRGDGLYRFIVKKDAPGLQATKMENKIGLRMVQNGDILLKKVFVPDEDRLPGVNSFKDTNKVWCFYSAYTLTS